MSKNRLVFIGLSVLLIAFAWFAPASSLATAVPIPAELNAWIAGLIFAAVTAAHYHSSSSAHCKDG